MMAKGIKFKALCLVLASVSVFSLAKANETCAQQQPAVAKVYDDAKIGEYRKLLRNYFICTCGKEVVDFTEEDRVEVAKLAEKLREFKKQLQADGVTPEKLDDYVCSKMEEWAGSFNVVNKEDFKKLGIGQKDQQFLWQAFSKNVAELIKKGQYKITKSYYNEMRGWKNYRYYRDHTHLDEGALNYVGGLLLQCESSGYKDLWRDYARASTFDFVDGAESEKLELWVPSGFEVLGFAVDLSKARQIDLSFLQRYRYLLMYEYPEEFGAVEEILKLKSIIQRHEADAANGEVCCWHEFRLDDIFDYSRQVEMQTQRELFGESMFDIEFSNLSADEEKKKSEELEKKLETLEFAEKYRENLIKAGKKEHITNENYYLLKNFALFAKLLGYDVINDPKRGSRAELYQGDFIVINANAVAVCDERFKSAAEVDAFLEETGHQIKRTDTLADIL